MNPRVAPIKAAVFPLVNKDGMPEISEKLYQDLRRTFRHRGSIEHDVKQAIGKRYARMDEAGCPFCITIDGDTAAGQSVTIRDRGYRPAGPGWPSIRSRSFSRCTSSRPEPSFTAGAGCWPPSAWQRTQCAFATRYPRLQPYGAGSYRTVMWIVVYCQQVLRAC